MTRTCRQRRNQLRGAVAEYAFGRPLAGRAYIPRLVAAGAALLAWLPFGCGGRTAIDSQEEMAPAGACCEQPGTGSSGGSGGTASATGGGGGGTTGAGGSGTTGTGGSGTTGTGGITATDVRDCLTCALGFCSSEFTTCLSSTACTDGLWCVATTCTNSTDTACVFGCFTDPAGALEALALWSCLSDNCGEHCLAGLIL